MGEISEKIQITGTRQSKDLTALLDSGAQRNYVRSELFDGTKADEIGFTKYQGKHTTILANQTLADGIRVNFIHLKVGELYLDEPEFIVMDDLNKDAIIGSAVMQQLKLILDFTSDSAYPRL